MHHKKFQFFSYSVSDKNPLEESSSTVGEQVQSGILSDEDVRNLTITSQDLEKVCLFACVSDHERFYCCMRLYYYSSLIFLCSCESLNPLQTPRNLNQRPGCMSVKHVLQTRSAGRFWSPWRDLSHLTLLHNRSTTQVTSWM